MTESTDYAHSILDDDSIARNGPFCELSIGDRVSALQAKCRCYSEALNRQREEIAVLEEQVKAAASRSERFRRAVEFWRGIDWSRIIAWLRTSGTSHVRGEVEGAIGMISTALRESLLDFYPDDKETQLGHEPDL